MSSTHTGRKRLERQTPGENNNTWGGYLNSNTIDLLDECFGLTCVVMTTAGDSTFNSLPGQSDEGRRSQIVLTGVPTSNVRLYIPARESFYVIRNKMTGSNKVTITNTGGTNGIDFSGTGSGAEQGIIISDGTNVREIFRTVSAASLPFYTKGMIFPFFNSVGAIPSTWGLCDGTNGTPNLQDRFILGTVSATNIDTSGGGQILTTASNGDHAHGGTVVSTALTSAHIPAHAHYAFAMYQTNAVADRYSPFGSNTDANSFTAANTESGTRVYRMAGHVTTANPSIGQTSWAYSSIADAHSHAINTGGGHQHTITDGRPLFHRMYYIMKL